MLRVVRVFSCVAFFLCGASLGASAQVQDSTEEASRFYQAWGLDARDPQALTDFGTLMANSGQVEQGRLYYTRALEQDPGLREAAYGVAVIDLEDGKVIEAVVALGRLSRGKDEFAARAHHRLARQSARDGFPDEALRHFMRAHEIRPEDLEIGLDLGTALVRREKYQEAEALSRQLEAAYPDSPMVWVMRGRALKGTGRDVASRQAFEEALILDPREPWALFEVASWAEESEDIAGARSLYRMVVSSAAARGEAELAKRARRALSRLPQTSRDG